LEKALGSLGKKKGVALTREREREREMLKVIKKLELMASMDFQDIILPS
jgi:hypothetical protein